ncbi:MAG TPA: TonB-dependent receptor [Cyclobacteriaceae bacterium]|nr:TonB-dependent receptor [Cyclobacteriaceae bacterium]
MLKYFSYVFILFSSFSQLNGQTFRVEGNVLDDESKKPLEYANASILSQSDSSLVGGATTDASGKFAINAKAGEFIVKIQFISYSPRFFNINLTQEKPTANLGTITLYSDIALLTEIVVSGQKGQMQLELDKRIFNVSADLSNVASNASEILDNLPSIAVDVDGNVSLRGSSNVRILVNGKPSGLVGISSPDALRQLQGDLIERIEVITNPSARYEAEGSAGIINIILKKEQEHGIHGSFTANAGYPNNLGFSGNVNYRSGKFNLFGSYGLNYRENPGGGFTDRITNDTLFTYTDNDRNRSGLSHNIRFGTDFQINENNTITVSAVTRLSDEQNTADITYTDRTPNAGIINNSLRSNLEDGIDNNLEYQLNYRREMEGEGHELTAQFQIRDNSETEKSAISSTDLLLSLPTELYQRTNNKEGDKNMLMQADYVYPFGNGKKIEAGYRGTLREIHSDYLVEEIDENGNFFPLANFSNSFTYDENVQAAYSIFENKMPTWGYQLGLRVEQTFIKTFQQTTGEVNEKEYFNAFPSAFVSYNLNSDRTLQASYSRRLSRPRFWSLNPFSSFTDPRNIRKGNPDLDPEYTDSYEIGILNNLKKSSIYLGGYYRYATGVRDRVQTLVDSITTVSTTRNIGVEDAYGLEANFNSDPTSWLSISGNANFYRAITVGKYVDEGNNEIILERDTYSARFRLSSKFKINKVNLQLSGNYRAPENQTQGTRKSMYRMDAGANMDVLKGKGTLNLTVRDILNTQKYRGTTLTENFSEISEFQWRSRQVRLSFTYRINQKKQRGGNERDDSDMEEGEF